MQSSPVRAFVATDKAIKALEWALMLLVVVTMVAMMLLVSVDALMRYLFNHPLGFTYDAVLLYLLPGVSFLAFSYTLRSGGHVSVDFIALALPPRVYQTVLGLMLGFCLIIVSVILYRGVGVTVGSFLNNEWLGGIVRMPVWVSKIIVPIGLSALVLRMVHCTAANLFAGLTGTAGIAYPAPHDPGDVDATEEAV